MNELCANCGKEKQNHVERNGHVKCVPEFSEFKSSGRFAVRSEFIEAVRELKRCTCWCDVGIGNPMYGGKHTEACISISAFFEQIDGKAGNKCYHCGDDPKWNSNCVNSACKNYAR